MALGTKHRIRHLIKEWPDFSKVLKSTENKETLHHLKKAMGTEQFVHLSLGIQLWKQQPKRLNGSAEHVLKTMHLLHKNVYVLFWAGIVLGICFV